MDNTRPYRVEFDTKKGGDKHWVIDLNAKNTAEAKTTAHSMWDKGSHCFHITAHRLSDTEEFLYHWFTEVE